MTTGELWVAHPLFPWLLITLSWWILCSTVVMIRNWARLRKLEQHNKLLQEMVVEGIGNIARKVKSIKRIPESVESPEECSSELFSRKAEIRIKEEPATAVEEVVKNGNDITDIAEPEYEDSVRSI